MDFDLIDIRHKNLLFRIVLTLLLLVSVISAQRSDSSQTEHLQVIKPYSDQIANYSGHNMHQTIGEITDQPIRVQVLTKNMEAVAGIPVRFSIVHTPLKAKGTVLEADTVITDENGIAQNYITLGSKAGIYEFSARIENTKGHGDLVFFRVHARKSDWVLMLIIGLIGGLALFLFGMEMMSDGMKKAAGTNMRSILGSLTNNRLMAVAVGTFVTMVIQSSSATTVMLVSFVQANLMTFSQSLGIILGADIGTTITAQLIAFKLTDYALLMIGIGFIAMFMAKSKKYKNIGETILGFGLLFFGMHIMSEAMYPLRTYQPFIDMLLKLENPLLGILVGTIFTALIQSSSAFTGIIIVLASQGLITLEAGIPLLFGANIGTSITAALASIGTGREAKRVALAHTLFKVFGVVLFVWWIPYFAEIIRWISPTGAADLTGNAHLADVVPRQIANAHTVFNVALAIIVLPFTQKAAGLITKMLPDREVQQEESPYHIKFMEKSLISTPALALNLAKAETIRMANKVQVMVDNILAPFFKNDADLLDDIRDQETEINYLNVQISNYLMKISQESISEERSDEIFQMMHSVTEIEQIGDIVAQRLIPLAEKKIKIDAFFSDAGQAEIRDYHLRTMKQLSRAIEVFKDENLKDAKKMERKYKKYRMLEMELRRIHYDRLREDIPETVATSGIHLDLIESLKRISSHATNIARIFIEPKRTEAEQIKNIETKKDINNSMVEKNTIGDSNE